jgi:DUF3037 family protein
MTTARVDYDFAVLRVVPRVHLGAFINVGVVVHARTMEFLALRAVTDQRILAANVPGVDADLLARYLRSCEAICAGDVAAGPMALAPPSERFHWLTAPRSDVLQSSPVHEGITEDPRRALDRLFEEYVTLRPPDASNTRC